MKEMKERRGEICRFDPVGRPSPSTTRDARANSSRPYFLGLRSFLYVCVLLSFVAIRVLTISHFSQRPLGALPLLVDGRTRSCNPGETDGISMYQSFKVHHRRNKKKKSRVTRAWRVGLYTPNIQSSSRLVRRSLLLSFLIYYYYYDFFERKKKRREGNYDYC